jgi:hypothetical protein
VWCVVWDCVVNRGVERWLLALTRPAVNLSDPTNKLEQRDG